MVRPDPAEAAYRRSRMVDAVLRHGDLLDARVLDALRAVPRDRFVPERHAHAAYDDRAMEIGSGQTISAPHMVAIMCTLLDLRRGHRVLEIGTGSGYHAAVMAHLVRPRGEICTIEVVPKLAGRATAALRQTGFDDMVDVRVGDGAEGAADRAPFDRISIAAATPEVPDRLLAQLGPGGRMVVPMGRRECILTTIDRTDEGLRRREHGHCVFVPLTGRHGV